MKKEFSEIIYKRREDSSIESYFATNRIADILINIFDDGRVNAWYDGYLVYNDFILEEAKEIIKQKDDGKEPPIAIYKLGSMFKDRFDNITTIVGMYVKDNDVYIVTDDRFRAIKLESFKDNHRNFIGFKQGFKIIEAVN